MRKIGIFLLSIISLNALGASDEPEKSLPELEWLPLDVIGPENEVIASQGIWQELILRTGIAGYQIREKIDDTVRPMLAMHPEITEKLIYCIQQPTSNINHWQVVSNHETQLLAVPFSYITQCIVDRKDDEYCNAHEAILHHELTHIAKKHALEMLQKEPFLSEEERLELRRTHERQADEGIPSNRKLLFANYQYFKHLASIYGADSGGPTHPTHGQRAQRLKDRLDHVLMQRRHNALTCLGLPTKQNVCYVYADQLPPTHRMLGVTKACYQSMLDVFSKL